MEYKDIIFEQINKIRQVRDDDISKYPSSIKTLLLLLPKKIDEKEIDQKVKELNLDFYGTPDLPVAWDEFFHFILSRLIDKYGYWFFPDPFGERYV